uniref:Uncharacterized protein n=1 Tax=Rhizophora mucronata TaxID=61149 RepID=A0A2P2P900_RHIMU
MIAIAFGSKSNVLVSLCFVVPTVQNGLSFKFLLKKEA